MTPHKFSCKLDHTGLTKARQSKRGPVLSCPAGLAMSRGVLQLLCSEQLPTAEMEEKLHSNEQRKRSRELSLQMRQSDDFRNASVFINPDRLQEAKRHQQYMAQHHAAALQDWQQQLPVAVVQSQQLQSAVSSAAGNGLKAGGAGHPGFQEQHQQERHKHQQDSKQHQPGQHNLLQQQDSKQQQSCQHSQLQQQDSFASDRTGQLQPRLRPALISRGRAESGPSDAMQHHSRATSNKKKVTWADDDVHVVCANTAAAVGKASSTIQEPALWKNLLLLQQLQQVSALPVSQLQLLLQELTALESAASSSGCADCLWSGQAGSCAGSNCFTKHIPSQPCQQYQQRAALMQQYGIHAGAAGQYDVQLQHVQLVLAAVQGHAQTQLAPAQQERQPAPLLPQQQQQQLSLTAELQGNLHSGVLHCIEVSDDQDKLPAVEPACSDTSAHTCNTAPGMEAHGCASADDADAQGCLSFVAAAQKLPPAAGAATTATHSLPVGADPQHWQGDVVSADAASPALPVAVAAGAPTGAGCVLHPVAHHRGPSAGQQARLAEPRRSSWPLPRHQQLQLQQQEETKGAAGAQAVVAPEPHLQSLQGPTHDDVTPSAQQATWQRLPSYSSKYTWVNSAVTHRGRPDASRDAMQDSSWWPDGLIRFCTYKSTACGCSWVLAPAMAATARPPGQGAASACAVAAAEQEAGSGPQHSTAATASEPRLAALPAGQTTAGQTCALSGASEAAVGTIFQHSADMLEAQHPAEDIVFMDRDLQRSNHSAAPDRPLSAATAAAAAADINMGVPSHHKIHSTTPGFSGSAAGEAAACTDDASAAAAPAWPLPVPEHDLLVFDWETHKHQLPGIAAAVTEPGKRNLLPVHILQHQPGQQQPLPHQVLALGRLTKTDFR
jgi:hypothetical protein